jgi:hypothetical protein
VASSRQSGLKACKKNGTGTALASACVSGREEDEGKLNTATASRKKQSEAKQRYSLHLSQADVQTILQLQTINSIFILLQHDTVDPVL